MLPGRNALLHEKVEENGSFMVFESSRCRRFSIKVKGLPIYKVDSNYALERRS